MTSNDTSPAGAGCLILAGFLLGSFAGIALGQASFGMVIGLAAGILLALAHWLVNRRG